MPVPPSYLDGMYGADVAIDNGAAIVPQRVLLRFLAGDGISIVGADGGNADPATRITIAQKPTYSGCTQTTGTTATTLVTIPVAAGQTLSIGARWHGRINAGTTQAIRESTFVYRRIGAGPVVWGSVNNVIDSLKDDATWGAMSIDVVSNDVLLRVVGKAATTINWTCEAWVKVL
jgi:hypothetical protein